MGICSTLSEFIGFIMEEKGVWVVCLQRKRRLPTYVGRSCPCRSLLKFQNLCAESEADRLQGRGSKARARRLQGHVPESDVM